VKRAIAAVAGALASLVLASPAAAALSPPELFVRLQSWDTHEAVSDWIPLASAPAVDYLGGYDIGYRLQDSGQPNQYQKVALTVTGVPDGQPTQPYNADPYCLAHVGTPGTIVDAGPELQFEGSGTYTVKVSLGTQGDDCLTGPASTASFTVTTHVEPVLVGGDIVRFRLKPLTGNPFVGIRAPDPPGGSGDVRCALNGKVQADGSVTGSKVVPEQADDLHSELTEDAFPQPGPWLCVTRGVAEGRDENFDRVDLGTSWSAPLTVPVLSDFRRYPARLAKVRRKSVQLQVKAEWPGVSNGGRASLTIRRITGCKRHKYRLRKAGTFRGHFGPKRLQLTLKRPRRGGYYIGTFAFGGTQFVRATTDPNPMLLHVGREFVEFAAGSELPRC
jgi:hypothetical protein